MKKTMLLMEKTGKYFAVKTVDKSFEKAVGHKPKSPGYYVTVARGDWNATVILEPYLSKGKICWAMR